MNFRRSEKMHLQEFTGLPTKNAIIRTKVDFVDKYSIKNEIQKKKL